MNRSAIFSEDRLYRYYLYRGWDESLPKALLIGLNPSTANENTNDPTISRLEGKEELWGRTGLMAYNGFGGFYMMNLFCFVSADPSVLNTAQARENLELNDSILEQNAKECSAVVFCWGNFEVFGRDKVMFKKFPQAGAFGINKNGSPKHPLYLKSKTRIVSFS